jgi:diguanylate cyclase (GGDEF)-like protein
VLPWFALVPAMATLRFRLAVSVTLSAVAALLILGVGFAVDPARALDYPVPMIAALVMVANIVGVSTALMQGELEHRDRAVLDPLTGLLNRASLDSRVAEIEQQAHLTGGDLALVMLDLDRFKAVNDDNGHAVGDAVLRAAAGVLRGNLRSFELVYRVGGEEFLVLMPGVDRQGGRVVAERLCSAMHAARPAGLVVTASFGVAVAHGAAVAFDPLFDAADQALYAAKRGGRNQVVVAPDIRPAVADAPSATAAGVGLPGAIARA